MFHKTTFRQSNFNYFVNNTIMKLCTNTTSISEDYFYAPWLVPKQCFASNLLALRCIFTLQNKTYKLSWSFYILLNNSRQKLHLHYSIGVKFARNVLNTETWRNCYWQFILLWVRLWWLLNSSMKIILHKTCL